MNGLPLETSPEREELVRLLEAVLFAADRPLSVERIRETLDDQVTPKEIRLACGVLRAEYDRLERAFELTEVAGGFQFRTRAEYGPLVARLRQTAPLRLSKAALETLSIVAYKQPVLRAELERLRGVDCGGVLKALLERGLVRILGRENLPGRPLTYGTTRRFLEVFELKSLDDLPSLEEISLADRLERIETGQAGLFDEQPGETSPPEEPEAEEAGEPAEPDQESDQGPEAIEGS